MLCDPCVRFEHIGGHMSVWCDDGPVVEESRELWSKFEDQPKVDASYPGLQIPQPEEHQIRSYRLKVIKATRPEQYARKSTVKHAVSLKLGWAYEGASFHPGKWDQESWSISGMGSVCCDEGYQKPWFYPKNRKYPIGFSVESSIETAVCPRNDGSIDIYFRVDGFDIESPLLQASRWSSWWRPTPVFRIPAEQAHQGLPMPAVAGGINFGPGWRVQLETEISPEFRREVLGEETPALPRVPRAPSASVPSVEEPEEPPRKKRCCRENPPQAKFCMECGDPLGIKAQGSTNQDELQIIGFSVEGLEETIEEDDWDALRALVHSKATLAVKQEDENAPLPIEEEPEVVPLEDVWPLQKTISRRFRNGASLESLIASLNTDRQLPMKDNRLILNMARAEINGHVRYYTFDHRRCWCMLQAAVTMVRARIRLQGPAFNEMVRKSNGLGAVPLYRLGPRR